MKVREAWGVKRVFIITLAPKAYHVAKVVSITTLYRILIMRWIDVYAVHTRWSLPQGLLIGII